MEALKPKWQVCSHCQFKFARPVDLEEMNWLRRASSRLDLKEPLPWASLTFISPSEIRVTKFRGGGF